jgi:DNA polymerase-3 subunit beta
MKISTTKEKILNAVLLAERITGKKESLPILSCILFEADTELAIRATNLEAGIEIRVAGDIGEKGVVAVPAHIVSQTLRSIGSDRVSFMLEDGNLIIESRGTRTLIKAIPHSEFPNISTSNASGAGLTIARGEFLRGLQSVSYAASQSMIRPELGSVYVSIKAPQVVCVATDSFRLAEKVISKGAGSGTSEILIPSKHASELSHVLERIEDNEITVRAEDSQLSVEGGSVRYISRIIDAAFPNYKEIIPKKFTTEATILKNDFAEMLRKARVFSGNDQYVGLHVYPKRKLFTATAQSADVGEMSDSIDAALEGEDLDINFHINYLADCLASIESDSLILGFSGVGRALVIHGVSDASFTYLVMPLNR